MICFRPRPRHAWGHRWTQNPRDAASVVAVCVYTRVHVAVPRTPPPLGGNCEIRITQRMLRQDADAGVAAATMTTTDAVVLSGSDAQGLVVCLSAWHETTRAPALPQHSLARAVQFCIDEPEREGVVKHRRSGFRGQVIWPASGQEAPTNPWTPEDMQCLLGGMRMLRECGGRGLELARNDTEALPQDAAALLQQCVVIGAVPESQVEGLAMAVHEELKGAVHVFWTHTVHCPPRQAVPLSANREQWSAACLGAARPADLALTMGVSSRHPRLLTDVRDALHWRDLGPSLRALIDCALPAHFLWLPLAAAAQAPLVVHNTGRSVGHWRFWACRVSVPQWTCEAKRAMVKQQGEEGGEEDEEAGVLWWPPRDSAFATAFMHDRVAHRWAHGGTSLVGAMLERHFPGDRDGPGSLVLALWQRDCLEELFAAVAEEAHA